MAEERASDDEVSAAPAKSGGELLKMLLPGVVLVIVVVAGQLGTMIVAKTMLPGLIYPEWMLALAPAPPPEAVEAAPAQPPPPPVYTKIDPSLVVSYQTDTSVRFLQVTLQAMARDEQSIAAFELHAPRIRNDLLMLFASESLDNLSTRKGKDRIRRAALEEIRSILAEEGTGAARIDAWPTRLEAPGRLEFFAERLLRSRPAGTAP